MSEQPQAPRPSLAPDLPPAPREEQLPAPPPAAQLTPSGRPLNVPVAVQLVDRLGDIVGVVALAWLCHAGKLGGELALVGIGAILGVGTGLRHVGARAGTAGVGVVGLLLLGLGRWLAPAAGAAELARASGLLGLLALVALAVACPNLPPVSGCTPLSQRCEGDRPQVCSPTRRWHTVGDEPCGATPGQSCQVRAGVAGCVRAVDAAEVSQ